VPCNFEDRNTLFLLVFLKSCRKSCRNNDKARNDKSYETQQRKEAMTLEQLKPGDAVYAASHIYNDGGIPEIDNDALLAKPGTRGVLIETGHLEEAPERTIYLVRFEDSELNLGPPTGCWPEELSANVVEIEPID
jgi:nitrogen fixation protein NifZ